MLKRIVKYTLIISVLTTLALLITLPASKAYDWAKPQLQGIQLFKVSGTIWHGNADYAVIQGMPITNVTWDIIPSSLLSLSAKYEVSGNTVSGGTAKALITAHMNQDIHVRDIKADIPIADLPFSGKKMAFNLADGTIQAIYIPKMAGRAFIDIPELSITDRWLSKLTGEVNIRQFAITTTQLETLGDYQALFSTTPNGIEIVATDPNDKATVGLKSNIKLNTDRSYQGSTELFPRQPPKGFTLMINGIKRRDGRYLSQFSGQMAQ